jgi:hypothetical protein
MYLDVFIPIDWKRVDPPSDSPNGVYLMNDRLESVVYEAMDHGKYWHCLVAEKQYELLNKDAIPFLQFSEIESTEKIAGAPRHVFGSRLREKTADGVIVYEPGKAAPKRRFSAERALR